MKKIFGIILLVIFIILSVWCISFLRVNNDLVRDYKDATYIIEGEEVKLVSVSAETEIASGSSLKKVTKYFGNEVKADLNNDGLSDVLFLLTQNSGGSGTFYYIVVALGTRNGYKGINAIFLGDRIAPQTTEFRDGKIIVNYAERKFDEPMTSSPSVGVSKYFEIQDSKLVPSV